ncbi:hypothetical protein D9Q98_000508 [Chlorella vulgaris]|uniref:Uncharacterized protein n=1 Tax=Chlorella vulgaris TaxID=3077 RepID=A0A9D4TY90_CHLVU|nr:hypothetical protein D9Q98_000508 [Chlorella vulgaris]
MFYSAQILSKKGALGSVWIASWSQRGLKRQEVFSCSLPAAVDSIINPEAPLALRLSGQLLLGLVRLYLRKLQFLEEDAGLALRGLNKNAAAGQGGPTVDLPDGGVAPELAITLQDSGYDPMAQFVGNELFPSFESSLYGEADGGAYGGGASVTVAQDISELFGSRWTGGVEDRDGGALERRFSTELERLRSQGVEAPRDQANMFFPGGEDVFSPAGVLMDDEVMAVPADDMFVGPAPTPSGTPASARHALLPGRTAMRITPHSLPSAGGAADLLPDFGSAGRLGFEDELPELPMPMEDAELAQEAAAAAAGSTPGQQQAARRRRQPTQRRRKPVVDSQGAGRGGTTLPSDEIRALLADRKPLMTRRGLRARTQRPPLPPGRFDVVVQSEAARDSELYRPASFGALAPQLLELFARVQTVPGQAAGSPVGQRRRRSSRGTTGGDEQGVAAAAAAEVAAEAGQPASPVLSGGLTTGGGGGAPSMYSGGEGDYGLPSPGGFGDEFLEAADVQQQQQQQAAAPFPAGPAAEDGGLAAGSAGERRGRLPLQLVLGSGEQPGELGSLGSEDGSRARSGASSDAAPQTAFTKNTALVLEHLRRELAPQAGSKRRHPSHGNLAAGMAALSLDGMLLGEGGGARRGRLDAARWFYESLVLRNTGFVTLEQGEPFADIQIHATARLTQPAL